MAAAISDTMGGIAGVRRSRFYLGMALAMAATAFLGFAPTFWLPMAQGIPERNAILAIHGTLFFGWTLLFVYQTWLVGSVRVARHRDVGLAGVSLATAMTIFGMLAAIDASRRAAAMGFAAQGETFMVVPLAALTSFALLVLAALLNLRRAEWHKRFMLSATAVLLDAPIARPFIVYVAMGGHHPPFHGTVGLAGFNIPPPTVLGTLPPSLIALLFIAVGMLHDWRSLGRVHPAYWWAGSFALALQLVKIPLSETAAWHGVAHFLMSLAG